VGEIGSYENTEGCTLGGLNWNQTAYNDAQSNLTAHNVGVGAAGYYMLGGPGREPGGFTTTKADATNWGKLQAQEAVLRITQTLGLPVVFMDIQDADPHGWNEAFSAVCPLDGVEIANTIASSLDRLTFNGFWDYINNNTVYFPAVYAAGGSVGSSWNNIFGSSQTLGNTLEWTYVNETSSLATFPAGWAVGSTHPVWYASAPAKCELMWQWSGGDGVNNGVGDFDQIDANNAIACA
jgi:hypothetical protein